LMKAPWEISSPNYADCIVKSVYSITYDDYPLPDGPVAAKCIMYRQQK
jgi:hypothetical protein